MKSGKLPLQTLESARLLDQVRTRVCYLRYDMRMSKTCTYWGHVRVPQRQPGRKAVRWRGFRTG